MKIGVSAFAWTGKFEQRHLGLLDSVKEMGLTGLEIPMFDPDDLDANAIRSAFERTGLDCTVCAILPNDVNPISPDESIRRAARQHLVKCIETAASLGARLVGGPLYAPTGYLPQHRPTGDEWNWAVGTFSSLTGFLDRYDMTLSIEPVNRSETFFLRTAREARLFCETIDHPRVGVTVDTFHANIEEQDISQAICHLGHHLKHVHASENDRGLLGTGHVDFSGIIRVLDQIGFGGYLMIEGFGYSPAESSAPGALWADPSVSPDCIAKHGAEYLAGKIAAL